MAVLHSQWPINMSVLHVRFPRFLRNLTFDNLGADELNLTEYVPLEIKAIYFDI